MGNSEADVSNILQKCGEALGADYCNRKQYADEIPQNKVFVDKFRIMDTEVTNGQYKQCVDERKCMPPDNAYWADPDWVNRPVTDVEWGQANAFAAWADGRLPTEAEWEKACRAADGDLYPWGSDDATSALANFKPDKQASTSPEDIKDVKYSSGAHGLYDMAGNVYEWTSSLDWTYPYKDSDGREDPKATGNRIVRGGSYAHDRFDARCANRLGYVASGENARIGSIGFRLVSNQPAE